MYEQLRQEHRQWTGIKEMRQANIGNRVGVLRWVSRATLSSTLHLSWGWLPLPPELRKMRHEYYFCDPSSLVAS